MGAKKLIPPGTLLWKNFFFFFFWNNANDPHNHHIKFEIFPVYYGLRGFSIGFVLWLECSANRHVNLSEIMQETVQ